MERTRTRQNKKFLMEKITILHGNIAGCLEEIINEHNDMDLEWFVVGETDLILREGEWSVTNPPPITLLNTCYK